MTMDVSLRLRLQNQLSREAKVAERDLKDLGDAARKLGSTGQADKLARDIGSVRREAERSEKKVGDLDRQARKLNTVKTSNAQKEITAIGTAADKTRQKIDGISTKIRNLDGVDAGKFHRVDASASKLSGTLVSLGGNAATAFASLLSVVSVDAIVGKLDLLAQKFREVNREVVAVAVTAGAKTPEEVAKIQQSNDKLALRYGRTQAEVNDARGKYTGAGIPLDQQEQLLEPTLKSAVATKSEAGTIASAVIALRQNLGITEKDVPLALDMIAKGTDLGMFEVEAFAKNLPKLATMYSGTGREGLPAVAELAAAAQIAMKAAGSPDIAAGNLENFIGKLSSPDSVKNFADAGVDLEAIKKRSLEQGTPYMLDVIDEVMRVTKGDEFRIAELFGDKEAKQALLPLINNRELYTQWLNVIRDGSAGMTDENFGFVDNTPYQKGARRAAGFEIIGNRVGEAYDRQIAPAVDGFLRLLLPEYNRQRTVEEEPELLKQNASQRLDVENELLRLQGLQREMGDGGAGLGPQINRLKEQLHSLLEEQDAIIQNAREAAGSGDLGVSTGKIPIPSPRPIEQKLGGDLGPAADQAMTGYNDKLGEGLDKAVTLSSEKAAEMQRVLNFTAQPTIQPNFLPPAPASPAPGQQSSINSGTQINQTITSPNSQHAARSSARAIRLAQAGSYYDIGRRLA